MSQAVDVVECAPRMLAAARGAVSGPRDVPTVLIRLLDSVYAFLKDHPSVRQTGQNVAVYGRAHGWMEAGVEIGRPFESDDGTIVCTTTPAGRAATAVHRGPYIEMSAAHSAVHEFCHQRGFQLAGPSWEIYGLGGGPRSAPLAWKASTLPAFATPSCLWSGRHDSNVHEPSDSTAL